MDENELVCEILDDDKNFTGEEFEFCRYGEESNSPVLSVSIVNAGYVDAANSFDVLPDDVFVASFPRTGTTWVQEITHRIKSRTFKESSEILERRFHFLEYRNFEAIEQLESPRFFKTHLTYDLLPTDVSKAKLIYVTRNPKDTVVSYYHFMKMFTLFSYKGTFEEFLQKFKASELPYTPFFSHVDGYMAHADDPNVLVVTYEALARDPASIVQKIANFLDTPLSENEAQMIVEETSFERMKNNPHVNYAHWTALGLRNAHESDFLRKGTVGGWRNYFTSQAIEEFDIWETENNKRGIQFEYDLE